MYSIRSRLIIWFFAFIVAVFAAVFIMTHILQQNSLDRTRRMTDQIIREYVEVNWEEKARSYAAVFADQLVRPMYTRDLEAIRDLSIVTREKGLADSVYVVDATGMVLSDGTIASAALGMEYDAVSMRSQEDSLLVSTPIQIGDEPLGFVVMEFDISRSREAVGELQASTEELFKDSLRSSRTQLLGLMTVVLLLGLLGAYILSRGFTRPLSRLSRAIEKVGRFDYNVDLPTERSDELGALARTLAGAVAYLQQTTVSRDYLEQIFDSLPLAMTVTDADGVVREHNPRFAALCGADPDAVSMHLKTALDFPDALYHALMRELRTNRYAADREVTLRQRTAPLHVLVSAAAVHTDADDEAAASARFLFTFLDISERKRAENKIAELNRTLENTVEERTRAYKEKTLELERANVRLMEADRLKSVFLSTVSHELRTPLTSVLGFSKLIQRDVKKAVVMADEEQDRLHRLLDRITDNASIITLESTRLTRLINDVLDLSRIESSQSPWNDTLLDVSSLASTAVDIARGSMNDDGNLELRAELSEQPLRVCMDPDRLQQVLTNLLNNAIKFTQKGSIILRTQSLNGHGVQISVTDTGKGISEDEAQRIFNRFYQSSGDILRDKPQGSGLGLAICKEIITHYDGKITVDSTPGKGATFTVTLPGADANCT